MTVARVTSRGLTAPQIKDVILIQKTVEQIADSTGTDVQQLTKEFFEKLDQAFNQFQQKKLIISYQIESGLHFFGVDFSLPGVESAQSIFGSTREWTKEEVDAVLGVSGEEGGCEADPRAPRKDP